MIGRLHRTKEALYSLLKNPYAKRTITSSERLSQRKFLVNLQAEFDLDFLHINSTPRKSLHDCSPYEFLSFIYGEQIATLIDICKIKRDKVILKIFYFASILNLNFRLIRTNFLLTVFSFSSIITLISFCVYF